MKRSIKFLAGATIFLAGAAHAQTGTAKKPAANDPAQDASRLLLDAIAAKPLLFAASTDARHDNEDYLTLKAGETRRIPLPGGTLVRLWSTAVEPEKITLTLEGLSSSPKPVKLLADGKAAFGTYQNKTFLWYPANESLNKYAFKAGVLIAHNGSKHANKWFYQATLRPAGVAPQTLPTADRILHGTPKLAIDGAGPALVRSLSLRFTSKPDAAALQKIRLLISLVPIAGGAPTEVVDVPLGPLVGSFKGDAGPLRDAMTEWDGQNLTLLWPMPFDGARQQLAVEVTGAAPAIEASVAALPTGNPYRFHAEFGSQLTVKKQPIPILKVTGEGAFAGLRMATRPAASSGRRAFAYLEGNEILKADGKIYEGTGTEDFFNSAWYFPEKPFIQPYGGLTERTALPPSVSMYRLMVPDALPFKRDFKFDFEVGRKNNADDLEYRWVAFWYQKESGTVAIEDALHSAGGDTSTNPLVATRVDSTPNGVKSLPDMPVAVEIVVGLVLLAGVGLALSAVFRRKKN